MGLEVREKSGKLDLGQGKILNWDKYSPWRPEVSPAIRRVALESLILLFSSINMFLFSEAIIMAFFCTLFLFHFKYNGLPLS